MTGFLKTGAGAHGLYPSRDLRVLYVSNRAAGSVSVVSFRSRRVIQTWQLPSPASPDMGGVSADGRTLWLSGRYNAAVYAINTQTGRLRRRYRASLVASGSMFASSVEGGISRSLRLLEGGAGGG